MAGADPKVLLTNPRIKILDRLGEFNISGRVADVGCGSGYFGIAVAKKFNSVEKVDCIEASAIAVERVIPRNIGYYDLSARVQAVKGSFDELPTDTYDVVFAMGALHHSKNLGGTMQSIINSLKADGLLIAQEPSMPDTTTHEAYLKKYNIVEERYGLSIRNGDRYDRFFRECEYKYWLVSNGFDICLWEDFQASGRARSAVKKFIRRARFNGFTGSACRESPKEEGRSIRARESTDVSWVNQMRVATERVEKKFFIARKSGAQQYFHRECVRP